MKKGFTGLMIASFFIFLMFLIKPAFGQSGTDSTGYGSQNSHDNQTGHELGQGQNQPSLSENQSGQNQNQNRYRNSTGFVDNDGNGINDRKEDDDGDGILNGQDPDWDGPHQDCNQQSGSGRQGHGGGQGTLNDHGGGNRPSSAKGRGGSRGK